MSDNPYYLNQHRMLAMSLGDHIEQIQNMVDTTAGANGNGIVPMLFDDDTKPMLVMFVAGPAAMAKVNEFLRERQNAYEEQTRDQPTEATDLETPEDG